MSKVRTVIPPKKDIEEKKELALECFTLVFHHEYRIKGESVKVDEPKKVQCVMPFGELYQLPIYDKEDIVRMLVNKLISDLRESGKHEVI